MLQGYPPIAILVYQINPSRQNPILVACISAHVNFLGSLPHAIRVLAGGGGGGGGWRLVSYKGKKDVGREHGSSLSFSSKVLLVNKSTKVLANTKSMETNKFFKLHNSSLEVQNLKVYFTSM